jgi:hypothetical protein
MSFKPMKPQDVDISKIEFTQMKKLDNGANVMYLNYDSKPIYITTPELDVPFDAQWWPDSGGDNTGKWSVKVNLRGDNSDPLINMLKEMDQKIKEEGLKNCVSWFKKRNMSAETVDTLYTPMLKVDIDAETGEPTGKYPPGLSFKIVKRDGNVNCKVYGENKSVYNVVNESSEDFVSITDLIKKNSKVKLLLRCNGLWVANGKFGCTWRAEQMKVSRAASFDECVFDDSDEEEVEKIDQNFVDSESEEETGGAVPEVDGSQEAGEVEEPKRTPAKKVRKVNKK